MHKSTFKFVDEIDDYSEHKVYRMRLMPLPAGNTIVFRKQNDKVISFAIVFHSTLVIIKNLVASTLSQVNAYNYILNIVISSIGILLYLYCLMRTRITFRKESFYIMIGSSMFILTTYFFHNELFDYKYVQSGLLTFFAYCLPLVIFIPLLHDPSILLRYFHRASLIIVIVVIGVFSLIITGADTIGDYSMSFGGNAMIPVIFLFSNAFAGNKYIDYLLAGIGTFIILFIGSRWPLLCIGAFVIAKVFQNLILGKYQVGTLIISICFLGLIIYFLPKLIFVISVILERMGISSRTINMLISDRIMSDSGRSVIRSNLIEQLNKSPFWGYGAFGSVIALNDETAHNFILDIMANFGYIIGSAIIISSILATIKTIKNTNNSAIRELVLIYSAMIWPKATVGGSFWVAEAYWMLIGLFILNRKLQNKSKIRDNLQ